MKNIYLNFFVTTTLSIYGFAKTQTRIGEYFPIGEKKGQPLFIQETIIDIKDSLNYHTNAKIKNTSYSEKINYF